MSISGFLADDPGTNPDNPSVWLGQIQSTVAYRDQVHSPADVEIKNLSIYEESRKVPSASKIGKEDVLHFKILWKSNISTELCKRIGQVAGEKWAEFVDPQIAQSAVSLVKTNPSIQEYINGGRDSKIDGQLANIHRLQLLVKSTPDDYGESSETQKAALLPRLLLQEKEPKSLLGYWAITMTPRKSRNRPSAKGKAPAPAASARGEDVAASGRSSAAGSPSSSLSLGSILSPGGMLPLNAQAEDEEVVNIALTANLMTLGLQNSGPTPSKVQWMPSRKQFFIGKRICEARTDGYLKALTGAFPGATLAICEVKPFIRPKVRTELEWQEGCQMAAWISHMATAGLDDEGGLGLLRSPDNASNLRRRLLVSQDHEQIFITIAEYGDKYVDYLFGGEKPRHSGSSAGRRGHSPPRTSSSAGSGSGWVDDGFLTMHTYGPFSTMTKTNRTALCTILHAFTEQLALPLKNSKMLF
ncbi:hypothetical protein V8F33_005495 [Rhypophila sp. PSN 637]